MDDLFETTEVTPGLGHNRAPANATVDLAYAAVQRIVPELPAWLEQRHATVEARVRDLIAAAGRAPDKIKLSDVATAEKFSDLRKQLQTAIKAANAARLDDKKVFDEPGKAIHTFWGKRIDQLEAIQNRVDRTIKTYMVETEAHNRKLADEARRKEEERVAKLQAKGKEVTAVEPAPEPERAKLSGDLGSTTSTRKVWTFRDLDRNEIDLEALRPYLTLEAIEAAVRQYIRAGNRSIVGATVFEDTQITTR
jgi:hypothetical protein